MPDFQFSEADSPPEKPASETPTPAAPGPQETPATKPSGFQFSTEETPAPPGRPAPKPVAPIPGPPIPNLKPPAIANPPVAVPNPPVPLVPLQPIAVPRATPTPPTVPPAVPTPTVPTPPVPNLKVATPSVPAPTVPNPLVPKAATPVAPTPPVTNPATRPTPVPIAVPMPSVAAPATLSDSDDGAPQDNFSRGLWNFGQKIRAGLDALEGPASWLLRVAAVIGICALAYILAATFFGGAGRVGNPKMVELTRNLDLASKAFIFSLIGASIATLLLGYEDNRLGFAVGVLGFLFHFGAPIATKQFIGVTPATAIMADHFRQGGYFLVMIGLVKGVADIAVWLWNLPERMKTRHATVGVSNQAEAKQRIIAREANMMSPCWKLPFCRESIRKQCPAFLAKTTCWKFGRGCYCDTEMISRIVRGESLEVIKAPTQQSRQGKPPCGRCYIYLEHQTYKFRMISPLVLPVTVLATWLVWPIYTRFFAVGNKAFDSIFNSLSFNSAKLTSGDMKSSAEGIAAAAQVGAANAAEIATITQTLFGVLLGFMLLIYVSKFIEWAIYKAKW